MVRFSSFENLLCQVEFCRTVQPGTDWWEQRCEKWTHWDLNPGPSACEADVIPLHHVPRVSLQLAGQAKAWRVPRSQASCRPRAGRAVREADCSEGIQRAAAIFHAERSFRKAVPRSPTFTRNHCVERYSLTQRHQWSSGRIHHSHRRDPSSIPGGCILWRR